MELRGKVAVITGAAGGIGRAISRAFLDEGACVVMVDRDRRALETAASGLDGEIEISVADVADATDTTTYFSRAVERFGKVDIAVLNAGILGDMAPITEQSMESFDRVIAVNVRGVWLGVAEAMRLMRERGGAILITSSVAGIRGSRNGLAAYATSKHAVVGLMKSAALEGAPHNIRVNTINPSGVETEMIRTIEGNLASAGSGPGLKSGKAVGRYARPDEIASLATFLVSDRASYCSGGVYMVDSAATA